MLQTTIFLLATLVCGTLAAPSIVEFQELFSEVSHVFEFELQQYRAKNIHVRSEVFHRILDALGNLTVEMRDITADYWNQIETHEFATPECLDMIRPSFEYYVWFGSLDISYMAEELDRFMVEDAYYRFYPVIVPTHRENSRAIYRTVQTLGRNRFVENMAGTIDELQEELEYYKNVRLGLPDRLDVELANVKATMERVENGVEWWHDFTVRWHRNFMNYQLLIVEHECRPEEMGAKDIRGLPAPAETFSAKLKELVERNTSRRH